MMTGTVKWFNASKGFGFIAPDEAGMPDVFVHAREVEKAGLRELLDRQRIGFETETQSDGRLRATNLRLPG